MSSINRNASTGPSNISSGSGSAPPKKPVIQFASAEEEKAALARRFDEAKAAVDRNQSVAFGSMSESTSEIPVNTPPPLVSSPISYESLYPPPRPHSGARVTNPPPAGDTLSPAFDPSLSEKERLRRAFAERDAAALAAQVSSPAISAVGVPSYFDSIPKEAPTRQPSVAATFASSNALSEKERLRRHFEEQDAARANGSPPLPPPRATSGRGLPTPRAKPTPPGGASGSSSRLLSAAEEKARLAAAYAAEDNPPSSPPPFPSAQPYMNGANVNGNGSASVDYRSIPPPPPLAPRPPKEYIEETQQEDETLAAKIEAIDKDDSGVDLTQKLDPSLELRPFTPFVAEFDNSRVSRSTLPPPPPLPPKVPLDDS